MPTLAVGGTRMIGGMRRRLEWLGCLNRVLPKCDFPKREQLGQLLYNEFESMSHDSANWFTE